MVYVDLHFNVGLTIPATRERWPPCDNDLPASCAVRGSIISCIRLIRATHRARSARAPGHSPSVLIDKWNAKPVRRGSIAHCLACSTPILAALGQKLHLSRCPYLSGLNAKLHVRAILNAELSC